MAITYILLVVLLAHIVLFRKLIFRWNVFGVFFIATLLFSIIGIMALPFFKPYFMKAFISFKLELITDAQIVKTQLIATVGFLTVLYAYIFGIVGVYKRLKCINHFDIPEKIKDNLSRTNFYVLTIAVLLFIFIYLFIKRDVLVLGILEGLLGRNPDAILLSRRAITSSYLYTIIIYNVLPFITIASFYLSLKRKVLLNKVLFGMLFSLSFFLILSLFQKRPLIIFMLSLFISGFVFKENLLPKKEKIVKPKKGKKRKYILYLSALFTLLLVLYYSATTYQFENVFQAATKLSEIVLTRVFGRLSIPAFFYVHYFPEVGDHYGFTNIGLLSKVFGFEHFPDTQILFGHFSTVKMEGSLAINSVMDFYGAFGYFGLLFGNMFLGLLLAVLDTFLDRLEKNSVNLIFIVFCFVFAYYLSQASLPRALLGYGFTFFVLVWFFLQKGFKVKFRRL
ncbi:hypothetical protein MNBD_BACTEROID03-1954 [hydrothermal vent metagenome]|uniref:Oligosaccharide repeat unit polymerase n=1 Tax=hydrothermal vent metagenome TaxID=652676 RepID=A0A3B0TFZ3_9ZZZZ